MGVNLRWVTPNPEFEIAFIARGSNPPNQSNPEFRKLFEYCLLRKKKHWSPFQMASMCVQIETSLAIAKQVIRHWSIAVSEPMDIQETSMRYMDPFEHGWGFQPIQIRKKGKSNRQSSEEPFEGVQAQIAEDIVQDTLNTIRRAAEELKAMGASNETIRMLYPQATTTRFFLSGSCRSWIHYFEQRLDKDAQLEHQEIADEIYGYFVKYFPTVAEVIKDDRFYNPTR